MSTDYHAFAAFADDLAEAARAVTTRHFRTAVATNVKADASPVTIADQETEALIREKIESAYPDHGIFGEEYGAVRTDAEFVWVLDPIDGTKSFVTGQPLFFPRRLMFFPDALFSFPTPYFLSQRLIFFPDALFLFHDSGCVSWYESSKPQWSIPPCHAGLGYSEP